MGTLLETTMKKAIRFGQRFAHKGHGQPFVVFYFVSDDQTQKPIRFFTSNQRLDTHQLSTLIDGDYTLFMPFAPKLSDELSRVLSAIHIDNIVIGIYDLKASKAWRDFSNQYNISLIEDVLMTECCAFNEVYLYQSQQKKPFVALSFGMSVDGKIATRTGDSRYISGPDTRQYVHQLRDYYQAILVGINTVRIDHPKLTARLKGRHALDPDKIILDSHLSISLDEPLFTLSKSARTIIVTLKNCDNKKKETLLHLGVTIVEVDEKDGRINLHDALEKLYRLGIDSVFVEGGSTVHYSFIKEGLFNVIYAYISPVIIGGKTAPSAVGGEGFNTLKESTYVDFHNIRRLGSDIVVTMRPAKKG